MVLNSASIEHWRKDLEATISLTTKIYFKALFEHISNKKKTVKNHNMQEYRTIKRLKKWET